MTFRRFTDRSRETQVAIITGGHPFEPEPFAAMLDAVVYDRLGYNWTLVEHPAATAMIERPGSLSGFDLLVYYDVPGQDYRIPDPPILHEPQAAYKAGIETLLEIGMPMLFLHHAIIGWQTWERYFEIMGGAVVSRAGTLLGKPVADSGYRADVTHKVTPQCQHPVTANLESGFTLTDQLYLGEVFEDDVTVLMRSDYVFDSSSFFSISMAAEGKPNCNEGWNREPGSNAMVWTKTEKASPIVYIQCGDGPSAYGNEGFRCLLGNAVEWLSGQSPHNDKRKESA